MKRAWVVSVLASTWLACPKPASPPDAGIERCTWKTPLTPGIPGSPGHFLTSPRNPNGDSELAALMRSFVEDWRGVRSALERDAGVEGPREPRHAHLRCAWPTDPADRNETFDGFAVNYLTRVAAFDARPSVTTYEGVLDGCQACHEVSCGGPLEVISGLRWSAPR